MDTIRIVFSRSVSAFSYGVRFMTWSDWSHCGILTAENTVVESAFKLGGVVETPFGLFAERVGEYVIVEMPCRDAQAIIDMARSQLGKKYDWTGLVGIAIHSRNWQEEDSWWCSELIAWSFDKGGNPLFTPEARIRITPQHLFMLYHVEICRHVN